MSDEAKPVCKCGHGEASHTSGMYRPQRRCEVEGCGCTDYSAMHLLPTGFTSPGDVLTPDALRQQIGLLISRDTNLVAFFEATRGQAAEMKRINVQLSATDQALVKSWRAEVEHQERLESQLAEFERERAKERDQDQVRRCPHCGRDRALYKHLCCEATMLETMKAKRDADTANAIRWLEGLGYRVEKPGAGGNREGGGGV
jgi:hypothetical protein